ncbi:MAG: protelomerase family protein [Rivularia sp. (in: cyanobacteria)]
MLNAEEQVKRREKLAKYSEQDLKDMTAVGLKRLANGIIPGYAKMKKTQLINELQIICKPEKVIAELIPNTPLESIELNRQVTKEFQKNVSENLGEWTEQFYKQFRSLVQSGFNKDGIWNDSIHSDIAAYAYRVIRFLDEREGHQNDGKLAFTTKLRYRTFICNLLISFVESEKDTVYSNQLKSCLEILLRQIKIQINDLTQQKKGLQERQLAKRKKAKETISFKPLHDFAVKVLSSLDSLNPSQWKRVSIALAIATGRRLAEIHQEKTNFEYVDKQHVNFTGQLKVKGDAEEYFIKNPSYQIPVLVNAELVVKGHQWLKDNKKVVDDSRAVNRRYSGDISQAMKGLKISLNINHDFFTYKGLRTIYAQTCNQIFNNNNTDNALYLAEILGHGRGELLKGENLIDMLTPQSYNSDFNVTDTDCVIFNNF